MAETIKKVEAVENNDISRTEELQKTADTFMEMSREMEAAGNQDMAQYYLEKAKELTSEAKPVLHDAKLGGWYAGYTANQWRDMAKEEFVKNGDSLKYKQYCDNAVKANG